MFSNSSGNNQLRTEFLPTPKMSSYLLALVISDFQCIKGFANAGLNGTLLIGSCGRPNVRDQLSFSLDVGIRSMEYLQLLFDIKYPLPKCGQFIFHKENKLY